MKRILIALVLFLVPALAQAQCNGVFPNNTVCGNVTGAGNLPRPTSPAAFQGSAGGTNGQLQYNLSGVLTGFTMTGDCTVSIPNIVCTKTNGVNFGAFATGTNAANLTGTISTSRFNSGNNASINTVLRGDGTWGAPASPACVRMWPSSNQTNAAAWNLVDAYGTPIPTVGTTTQGLQEGITYSVTNGQCMQVYGQSILRIFQGNGTTHSNTTIDGISSTTGMLIGDYVTGSGIPGFTTITNVNSSTQITISNAATTSTTASFVVTRGAGVNRQNYIAASSSIFVPPFEQWSFDAYSVNLTFAPSVNGAGLQFDSGIIGHFGWWGGQIVYQPGTPTAASCAVSIAPQNPVPLDGIPAYGDNDIFISNIAAPAASNAGQGVWCVSLASGSVVNNHIGSNEINGTGVGSTPNAAYGFVVANAATATSFKGNKLSFTDVHLVASAGILLGTSTTNQTHYADNEIYANVSPGLGGACFSSYGSNNKTQGSCRNDQAGGALSQAVNFQAGAVNNSFDVSYSLGGVTTPLVDAGSNNSGFLNGLFKSPNGWLSALRLNAVANPVSALPACGSATAPEGSLASVNDANSNVWGAGVAGGGANHILAYCNGGGWTIAGK